MNGTTKLKNHDIDGGISHWHVPGKWPWSGIGIKQGLTTGSIWCDTSQVLSRKFRGKRRILLDSMAKNLFKKPCSWIDTRSCGCNMNIWTTEPRYMRGNKLLRLVNTKEHTSLFMCLQISRNVHSVIHGNFIEVYPKWIYIH